MERVAKMMKRLLAVAVLSILVAAAPARAIQWIDPGARSMAMGGAFVGVGEGPLANYWNPAGLGTEDERFGAEIPFAFRAEVVGDVIGAANDLNREADRCRRGVCDVLALQRAINRMDQPGNGLLGSGALSVSTRAGRFGLFAHSLAEIGASPEVDRLNTTPLTIDRNQSRIIVRGINATEIGGAYGQELFGSGIFVGGALKAIVGRVGFNEILVVQEDPQARDVLEDFDEDSEVTVQPGVDLAALWELSRSLPGLPFQPRAGLALRNLNGPSFDSPVGPDVDLDPQARLGFSVRPVGFWTIAMDVDLTDNDTLVDGFSSRSFGLGTEVSLLDSDWLNLPLRVGLTKNLAESDSDLSWTFGAGIHVLHVMLDVAGQVSSSEEALDAGSSDEVPTNFSLAVQLSAVF